MASNSAGNNGMSWQIVALLLTAETTSLGVLALPATARSVGLVPDLALIALYEPIQLYTIYHMYRFCLQHLHIKSFAGVMEHFSGRRGWWIGVGMQTLYLVFVMAAHIVGFANAITTIDGGSSCRIAYKIAATGLLFICSLRRNLKGQKWLYVLSCLSIIFATIIAICGVIMYPESSSHYYNVVPSHLTSLAKGAEALNTIIVCSMSQIAVPSIMAEMENPRDFMKAVAAQQVFTLTSQFLVSGLFYRWAGQDVTSPALGSAHGLLGKIAYGVAIPNITMAGVIAEVIAAKTWYTLWWGFRGEEAVTEEKSVRARGSWYAVNLVLGALALLLAWGIPIFEHLFSLMGALFGTLIALVLPAIFWFGMKFAEGDQDQVPEIVTDSSVVDSVRNDGTAKEQVSITQVETGRVCSTTSQRAGGESAANIVPTSETENQARRSTQTFRQKLCKTFNKYPWLSNTNLAIVIIGVALLGIGTYGSVVGIMNRKSDPTGISC